MRRIDDWWTMLGETTRYDGQKNSRCQCVPTRRKHSGRHVLVSTTCAVVGGGGGGAVVVVGGGIVTE